MYAHKFVVGSISDIFRSMFSDRWSSENLLQIKTSTYEIFKELLTFAYSQACNLTDENVFDVADLAEFYNFSELMTYCDNYFLKMEITPKNIFCLHDFACKYSLKSFKARIEPLIRNNIQFLIKASGFLDASKKFVEMVVNLPRDQLNEEELFKAVSLILSTVDSKRVAWKRGYKSLPTDCNFRMERMRDSDSRFSTTTPNFEYSV